MSIEIKAPQFPESVADGTVATWHKQEGEAVKRDELLVDIETDKVVLEVVAPADGVLTKIIKAEGDTVESQELLGEVEKGAKASGDEKSGKSADKGEGDDEKAEGEKTEAGKAADKEKAGSGESESTPSDESKSSDQPSQQDQSEDAFAGPAARKLISEHGLDSAGIKGTGKGGRITREDVEKALTEREARRAEQKTSEPAPSAPQQPAHAEVPGAPGEREERRVPMTRLRKRIAERLVSAQQNAAMLTTYNEVNMKPVMELRSRYKELFEKTHNGARLGFMSFFVKAATEALKRFPDVNASIDGDDVVYHGFYDVGVAVSSDRGLVVPVLRDADSMGLAEIETQIREFGARAQKGQVTIDEMQGGTFTISNGGVFGSLMSTPILNPPQTAIMGMHKIQERPMAVNGQVEILPMMYLALSYDHRMIDGKEAVQFLVTIKELLEDPARILLDV